MTYNDLRFLSRDHAHAQLQAKLWPALKPLFTAKEIPIEASVLCFFIPDDFSNDKRAPQIGVPK